MHIEARLHRPAMFAVLVSVSAIAGCSGNASNPGQCNFQFFGSAGAVSGVLVAPENGATAVPTSAQTLVFNGFRDYSIVLQATSGAASGPIQTTPTALPSSYPTNSPQTSTVGNYAVSVPPLRADTSYAVGTLSNVNECVDDFTFRQFGIFTTR